MTKTEIRKNIERQLNEAQSQRTDRMGYYSTIDSLIFTNGFLIDKIADLQYQINELRENAFYQADPTWHPDQDC